MVQDNCRELLDKLSDYIDDDASKEICAKIQRHMADCHKCRIVVDTLRKTVLMYRQLPGPDMSYNAQERLYKALDLSDYLINKK